MDDDQKCANCEHGVVDGTAYCEKHIYIHYIHEAEIAAIRKAMNCVMCYVQFPTTTNRATIFGAIARAYQDGKDDQARIMREEAERSVRI